MLNNIWQKCLIKLKNHISKYKFNIWILPLQVIIYNNSINLYAPNNFVLNYVKKNYLNYIYKCILKFWNIKNKKPLLKFLVGNKYNSKYLKFKNKININYKFKYNFLNFNKFNDCILLKKYKFNNFIFNKSNIIAYKESKNICNFSYRNYKSLFIYSNTGLGKTHLLHSIGNKINNLYNFKKNVIYISSENFVSKMINCLYNNLIEKFKLYFKLASILLIDDIQFLSKKYHSQEEFFCILNNLLENNRFIVLTSNNNIKKLNNIDTRIISRISCGLIINIKNPDFDLRYKFLIKKSKEINLFLNEKILYFIAKKFIKNFFELEGILHILLINSIYFNCVNNINIDFVKKILYKIIKKDNIIKIYDIQKIVSNYYNITINDLLSKYRYRSFVLPRHMSIAISKKLTNYSLSKLGKYFGGLNHSTILYSCNKIKELCIKNFKIKLDFKNLTKIIISHKNEIYYRKK